MHLYDPVSLPNEAVRAKIQRAVGPHEDLLTIGKIHKLRWYGQVSNSSGLVKTILQGTVKGGRDKADRGRGGKTISGNHYHHHQSLNRKGRLGTTDDFETSFLHFSLFSTALWDLANSRPDVVFPPVPLSALSSSPFHRALQDGFGQT